MKKKKQMPLEDHLKTADDLAIAKEHLSRAFFRVQEYHPKSSKLMKQFSRLLPGIVGGAWTQLKSELDREYHRLINDEQFKELGHIYYRGARNQNRYRDAILKAAEAISENNSGERG